MVKNIFLIVIIFLILSSAIFYIYKAKKRGEKCIGCPCSKQCSGQCSAGKER